MKNLVKQFKKVHNKYDYSKVVDGNCRTKVCIICPDHGEFWQMPFNHLNGQGCPDCGKKSMVRYVSNENFIKRLIKKFGKSLDFSKVNYKSIKDKIIVTCKIHGDFEVLSHNFLKGNGCPKCVNEKESNNRRHDFKDLVKVFDKVHNFKYDYSKSVYQNYCKKIEIICPKHGEFWQTVDTHIRGCGCPVCKCSKGELSVENILIKMKIEFIRQKRFKECKNIKTLPFDFYLPDHNTCIEFNGRQHYEPLKYIGGIKELEKIQKRDLIKEQFCKNNKINLIKIPFNEFKNIERILKEKL